jgi:fructokinase
MILCWGELLWDLFPDRPRLGGGAANLAYHLAKLGNRVALVSRVGHDELGERAIEELARAGVDTSLIQTDRERPTGTVRVELDGGEPRFFLAEAAAWDRIELAPAALEALRSARALCHGTLAQKTPLGLGALAGAIAAAPSSMIRICDLNVRPPHTTREAVEAAIGGADVVKLNEAEAELVAELFAVEDAAGWLLGEQRVGLVALTRGERGAELRSAREQVACAAAPARSGDRVGAGDAFTAALAHLLIRGQPLARLADLATAYASFVASQQGAMPEIPEALRAELTR